MARPTGLMDSTAMMPPGGPVMLQPPDSPSSQVEDGGVRQSHTSEPEASNGSGAATHPQKALNENDQQLRLPGCHNETLTKEGSRSARDPMWRSTSLPVHRGSAVVDKDEAGALKARRSLPTPLPPRKLSAPPDGGSLPKGVALYYKAKAAQEAQAQMIAKAAGAGPWYADYMVWRRRHKIPQDTKVFCMGGNGNHSSGIRSGLLARGWHENTDHDSPFFDFKWTISAQDIDYDKMWPDQLVNHYSKSSCITTKLGLAHTVHDTPWYVNADHRAFYPRAYDLSDDVEKAAWLDDARVNAAEAIVKRAAAERAALATHSPQSRGSTAPKSAQHTSSNLPTVDLVALRLALRVSVARLAQDSWLRCERAMSNGGSAPSADARGAPPAVELTPAEWAVLISHPSLNVLPPKQPRPALDPAWFDRDFITSMHKPATKAQPDTGNALVSPSQQGGTMEAGRNRSRSRSSSSRSDGQNSDSSSESDAEHQKSSGGAGSRPASGGSMSSVQSWGSMGTAGLPVITVKDDAIKTMDVHAALALAVQVSAALDAWHVQTHANGMNNLWIVKPAGKSRGRGIRLFNDPAKLLQYVRGEDALSLEGRWVVQKYVERPLLINSRKWDIRQWVLVTSWDPLTVWFWDTCYLRFAAEPFNLTNHHVFNHLTNNSISKHFTGTMPNDDITAHGNMWTVERFKAWLGMEYRQHGLWERLILPAMQHIVVCTTTCARYQVMPRDSAFQLLGYDFMVDDQLHTWLLEINSSPTMEASTAITTRLCADVQEDILKVVVDLPPSVWRSPPRGSGGTAHLDTGRWRCIVNSGDKATVPSYNGLNLELKGKAVASPRVPMKKAAAAHGGAGSRLAVSAAAESISRLAAAAAPGPPPALVHALKAAAPAAPAPPPVSACKAVSILPRVLGQSPAAAKDAPPHMPPTPPRTAGPASQSSLINWRPHMASPGAQSDAKRESITGVGEANRCAVDMSGQQRQPSPGPKPPPDQQVPQPKPQLLKTKRSGSLRSSMQLARCAAVGDCVEPVDASCDMNAAQTSPAPSQLPAWKSRRLLRMSVSALGPTGNWVLDDGVRRDQPPPFVVRPLQVL